MELVLLERVESLGLMGDIVTVKPGYARNYLLPQKKALRATPENMAVSKRAAQSSRRATWSARARPKRSPGSWKASASR